MSIFVVGDDLKDPVDTTNTTFESVNITTNLFFYSDYNDNSKDPNNQEVGW